MVRLVFRPYTQIWRSICTSEPLRTSTRVSPGFALPRHSSPSFGSQHKSSNSNLCRNSDRSMMLSPHILQKKMLCFHFALGFATLALACMLDSLVRVSRRAVGNHFVSFFLGRCAESAWEVEQSSPLPRLSSARNPSWLKITLVPNTFLLAVSGTFYSLFKVLFIFPSQYLFAIGFSPVFSFGRNLPPD